MNILSYVLIPVLIVSGAAVYMWLRDRQPGSVEHGVDSFRREMDALSPDAQVGGRRRPGGESGLSAPVLPGPSTPPGVRRPAGERPVPEDADGAPAGGTAADPAEPGQDPVD